MYFFTEISLFLFQQVSICWGEICSCSSHQRIYLHQYWKHDAEVDIRQAYRRGNGFMFIFSTFFVKLYSDAKVAFLESDYL